MITNTSLTLDNTFSCHENERWWSFYKEDEELLCWPIDIGYNRIDKSKNIYENLKIKKYMKIGEECSICLEPMFHKSNLYITDCGHSFHYTCVSTGLYMDHKYNGKDFDCPICRQDIGDTFKLKHRYPNSINKFDFDKLEDFWNNIHTELPAMCYNNDLEIQIRPLHERGIKKNCKRCILYRNTGKLHNR